MRMLQFLPLPLQLLTNQLESRHILPHINQILNQICQLPILPVYIVTPVYVLRLPRPIAVHYLLVHTFVLPLQLLHVLFAPFHPYEVHHLIIAEQTVMDQLSCAGQSLDDLGCGWDRPLDLLPGVDHHLVDGLSDGQLQNMNKFFVDLHHMSIHLFLYILSRLLKSAIPLSYSPSNRSHKLQLRICCE